MGSGSLLKGTHSGSECVDPRELRLSRVWDQVLYFLWMINGSEKGWWDGIPQQQQSY